MNLKQKKKPKVLVVAHDAGGAEVIAAYVRTHPKNQYHVYAAGPALRIFRRNKLSARPAPTTFRETSLLVDKHAESSFALLGTGWMTRIEWNALLASKRAGMHTSVFLDSWINFREVFGYPRKGWRKNLPDEIWVGDSAGLVLAKRYFPRTHIRFIRNRYFADIIASYKKQARTPLDKRCIVFMSAAGTVSERICSDFLSAMSLFGVSRTVRVRLHPADLPSRYKQIIRKASSGLRVEISRGEPIVRDLLRASVVVGPETNALVPAHMLGITAIRIVPKGEKAFLPFQKIIRVKSAAEAVRKIAS